MNNKLMKEQIESAEYIKKMLGLCRGNQYFNDENVTERILTLRTTLNKAKKEVDKVHSSTISWLDKP